jgi:hypothetical protein
MGVGSDDEDDAMVDFEAALQAKLVRNAELAQEREQAEEEMDRVLQQQAEERIREEHERRQAQMARHDELVQALQAAANGLKQADPEGFVVRLGWTESRQEFIAKVSTRLVHPARSLFVELDRDDDEVLVRWHSDLGNALELWHLLEVPPEILQQLVIQVADQELWRDLDRPPRFPRPDEVGGDAQRS